MVIPKTNAPASIGEAFVLTGGLKGFWLSSSYNVQVSGALEVRSCGQNCFEYRNLHTAGEWHDDVDANSFPGISNLKGETRDTFDNEDFHWLLQVIEGVWDIVGDGVWDTDFGVTVGFADERPELGGGCCDGR
jgi:hypothetical protein